MKLVWDNGGATIEAPKKCRSGKQGKRDAVMDLIDGWTT